MRICPPLLHPTLLPLFSSHAQNQQTLSLSFCGPLDPNHSSPPCCSFSVSDRNRASSALYNGEDIFYSYRLGKAYIVREEAWMHAGCEPPCCLNCPYIVDKCSGSAKVCVRATRFGIIVICRSKRADSLCCFAAKTKGTNRYCAVEGEEEARFHSSVTCSDVRLQMLRVVASRMT